MLSMELILWWIVKIIFIPCLSWHQVLVRLVLSVIFWALWLILLLGLLRLQILMNLSLNVLIEITLQTLSMVKDSTVWLTEIALMLMPRYSKVMVACWEWRCLRPATSMKALHRWECLETFILLIWLRAVDLTVWVATAWSLWQKGWFLSVREEDFKGLVTGREHFFLRSGCDGFDRGVTRHHRFQEI